MYDLNSKFNIKKHKETFINYLEVIILPNGIIEYAVPSHQEKLVNIAKQKLNVNREQLEDMVPREYFWDFLTWLCMQTNAIAVYRNEIFYYNINKKQISRLQQLKNAGLYVGDIPKEPIKK